MEAAERLDPQHQHTVMRVAHQMQCCVGQHLLGPMRELHLLAAARSTHASGIMGRLVELGQWSRRCNDLLA